MADEIMFDIGIGTNTDLIDEVLDSLKETLSQKWEIDFDVLDSIRTLDDLSEKIQLLGGQMSVMTDVQTGFVDSIRIQTESASGLLVDLTQRVRMVNGAYELVSQTIRESSNTELYEQIKEFQEKIIRLTRDRTLLEISLALAIRDGNASQVALILSKIDKNETLSDIYKDQLAQFLSQNISVEYFSDIYDGIFKTEQEAADLSRDANVFLGQQSSLDYIQAALSIKLMSTEIGTYYTILKQVDSTQASAVNSERYKELSTQLQQSTNNLQNLSAKFLALGVTVTNSNGLIAASYNGQDASIQKLVQDINKRADAEKKVRAAKTDQEKDNKLIQLAVDAYKAYRDLLDRIAKLEKEREPNVNLKQERETLEQLEQTYRQLEQAILSNGEAVKKNTTYNRDKNQVTRDSIQEQKKYNLLIKNNSLADMIAETVEYTLSLRTLKQVMDSVISTTFELNSAMTQIQLVTGLSNDEAKELISEYANLAKELGTTTTAVAESATEWLFIRSL